MFNHENFKEASITFHGIYIGVVEDNNDPTQAGRVRVRVLGLHTSTKLHQVDDGIAKDELPWAIPAGPIGGGSISGQGWSSVPAQGSHVLITFISGIHSYPVYFGSIAGKYLSKPNTDLGFSDPDGNFPKDAYIGEPDWNKAARGEVVDHGATVGSEPANPSAPVYPNNDVLDTGQIIVEHDSTPGKERWCITHKPSKSYMEIHPNGDIVHKSVAGRYDITVGANNIYVGGAEAKTTGSTVTETIGGKLTINVTGDVEVKATGLIEHSGGGAVVGDPTNGVVQGKCNCIITGLPHPFISAKVRDSI